MLPSAAAALGLTTVLLPAGPFTSTRARPLVKAAARAASRPGTEVVGAEVHGHSTGRRGPWARLIRRRASTVTPPTSEAERELIPATTLDSDQ
jgi:hypothetical protein